jgi:hypothetical protein
MTKLIVTFCNIAHSPTDWLLSPFQFSLNGISPANPHRCCLRIRKSIDLSTQKRNSDQIYISLYRFFFFFWWISSPSYFVIEPISVAQPAKARVCCHWYFLLDSRRFHIEVSAMGRSLIQRSPTDCGLSLCVISEHHIWGDRNAREGDRNWWLWPFFGYTVLKSSCNEAPWNYLRKIIHTCLSYSVFRGENLLRMQCLSVKWELNEN